MKNRKKWLLSILPAILLLGMCFACSTGDEDEIDDKEKPILPEEPQPTKKEYMLISIQTRSSYKSSSDTTDMARNSEIEIFNCTGIKVEKRKEDLFGTAYDKTNNKPIQAFAKVSDFTLYNDSLVVGEQYYIHIKTLKDNHIKYNYESALSDTIITIKKSDESIKLTKIFSLRAEDNQYESWTKPNRDLPKPDFGVANWGDTKQYVEFNETKIEVGSGNKERITYNYNGSWYTYLFDNIGGFYEGIVDYSIQFDYLQNRITWPIRSFQHELTELEKIYGEPVSKTEDVFRYDADNYTTEDDPDNASYQSQRIMRGSKTIEYKYQNDQKEIIAILSYYSRSDKTRTWGYTIKTFYRKRIAQND